jgi:hypothetical protein
MSDPASPDVPAVEPGDVTLGHVDLDDLLKELLDRAVELLHADIATVLLLDASGVDLVARAARGLEEEVRQGVRVPVGVGFAGRIAAEGRTVILEEVDDTTVRSTILRRHGIKALLGTPLRAGGELVGVITVGSASGRSFTTRDVEILELIADQVGIALHVRLLEADRDAAEAVQRSLLPSAPARVAEFSCAARYVPAGRGGLGGDWYDVFQLEDGGVWFVVGDIAGHGLKAATIMGRVRSALRAYALLGDGPDAVLAMTDRKMAHFEVGTMATAAIAVSYPPYDEVVVALAGHPPPVSAEEGSEPELLDLRPGPPLGVGRSARPSATPVPLAPGGVLVGYTDGLVERRGEPIHLGLERVRAAVSAKDPSPLCDDVMATVIGDHIPEDDIALLAIRRLP